MPAQIHSAESLTAALRAASHARFLTTDLDGVCRGKTHSGPKLAEMVLHGGTISSAAFGWDIADDLYQHSVEFANLHTALGEIGLQIDPKTARQLPWDDHRWTVLADHTLPNGTPLPFCPRQVLKRVLSKAEGMGLTIQVGVELEWVLLQETQASLRAKGYRGLNTATQSVTNYSPLRIEGLKPFIDELMLWMPEVGIPIESLHTEAGPGNLEVALSYAPALEMADRVALFKQGVREIGVRHGLLSTFMAKWASQYGGCGMHLHQSVWDGERNLFASSPETPSSELAHYMAGQLRSLPELCVLYAPNINSYKRLVGGMLAPTQVNWGMDDRHASLRVISGSASASRLETRVAGADANIYLVMAAAIASGLNGLEHEWPLDPTWQRGAGSKKQTSSLVNSLPTSLEAATDLFESSSVAQQLLGSEFVQHFAQTRRWELSRFRHAVTDWELMRYLELI